MEKLVFESFPSTDTPINATNLNQVQTNVENAIKEVSEDVDAVNKKLDLSTTEKIIGTWIDGKPLYRKTVELHNLNADNSLGIANIDTIYINPGLSYMTWDADAYSYTINRGNFSIYKPNGTIKAENTVENTWIAVVTVEYTKKTD